MSSVENNMKRRKQKRGKWRRKRGKCHSKRKEENDEGKIEAKRERQMQKEQKGA
jgi:hypothetical protein